MFEKDVLQNVTALAPIEENVQALMVYSHWLGREPGPGPGQGLGRASINQWKHFQDLKDGYQTHSSGPENVPSVLIKKNSSLSRSRFRTKPV